MLDTFKTDYESGREELINRFKSAKSTKTDGLKDVITEMYEALALGNDSFNNKSDSLDEKIFQKLKQTTAPIKKITVRVHVQSCFLSIFLTA